MKKLFKHLIFVMIFCFLFVGTGCNLFPQNYAKYLKQSVVTLNFKDGNKETIEITKEEYLTAYNNYGAQLIENGSTESEAKQKTIEALINRKALLRDAKQKITLSNDSKKELLYDTYQAMLSNAQDYEDQYKEDNKIDKMSDSEVEEGTVYTAYEKKAKVEYDNNKGEYVIKTISSTEYSAQENLNTLSDVCSQFYNATKNDSSEFKQISYRKYLNSLRKTQELKETNYSNDELFLNEAKRIYENLEDNWYVEKYEELYTNNNNTSTISVEQVLNKYKTMMITDNFYYSNTTDNFNTDMLSTSDFKNVDYFVNDNYFYVTHILVKLSDAQTSSLETLKTKLSNGLISETYYNQQKTAIYNQIMASPRNSSGIVENGKEDSVSVNTLLANLNSELNSATTNSKKIQIFKDYLYKYNEDDGIMNAEYPYVIGTTTSNMVENFTNTSRELNSNGTYGAISGLVESEYGVHIIMYLGKCQNTFTFAENGNLNLTNADIYKMDQTLLNPLNNKTLFDKVYEELVEDNYSILLNMQMTALTSSDVLSYTVHSDRI